MKSSVRANLAKAYAKEGVDSEKLKESKEYLRTTLFSGDGNQDPSIKKRITTYFDYFGDEFTKADVLAGQYQNKYRKASVAIYCLSAFAVMAISAQYIFHLPHLVGALEIVAMVMILVILFRGNRVGWHRRWLDYRFLAEKIRYGLHVAILVEKGQSDADKSLACRSVGDSWCLKHYQSLWQERPRSASLTNVKLESIKSQFNITWLEHQRLFHEDKKQKVSQKHKRISLASELFFWLTLIAACLHLLPTLLHIAHVQYHIPNEALINSILTYFAIVFPTIAAALTGLRSHFEYKKISDRSEMMENNLSIMQLKLIESRTIAEVQELALEAESLMVQENSDWYVTVRLHELEPA